MNKYEDRNNEPLVEVDVSNPNWVHAVVLTAAVLGIVAVIWICCQGVVAVMNNVN